MEETKQVWHRYRFRTRRCRWLLFADKSARLKSMNALDFNTRKCTALDTCSMSPWPLFRFRDEYTVPTKGSRRQGRLRRIQRQRRFIWHRRRRRKVDETHNENLEKLIEKNDIIKTEYLAYETRNGVGG